jgi:hypothetical protein
MEEKEIFKAETSTELELPMYEGLQAGFPSPATDYWIMGTVPSFLKPTTPSHLFKKSGGVIEFLFVSV